MENELAPISYANLQLEALAQVHSHLMRNAVHDLRTPLVAIRGYAHLLLREHAGPLTGAQHEYVATMLGNAERMICELNGMSELGKSEPVQLTSFDLSRL
jgi:two-component system sensor histidine kinase ChiS